MEWFRNGDRNTKYFHACANQRNQRNNIDCISDGHGRSCSQPVEIEWAFINYFQSILTSSNLMGVEECTARLESKVTRAMNTMPLAGFMNMEVKDALDQMDPLKARGPNGFSADFY